MPLDSVYLYRNRKGIQEAGGTIQENDKKILNKPNVG